MTTGDAFAHNVKGKARAKGQVDVLKPGDEGHGGKASSELEQARGLRAETRDFQHDADSDPQEQVVVFDQHPENEAEDIVLFTGTPEQAERLHSALSKHLKKK